MVSRGGFSLAFPGGYDHVAGASMASAASVRNLFLSEDQQAGSSEKVRKRSIVEKDSAMVSSFRGRRQKSSEMGARSWGLGARMQRKKGHLREIEEVRRQKGRRQPESTDQPRRT